MDIATILGMFLGVGFIIGTILIGSGIGIFIDPASIMIVCGGTVSAVLVAYPLKEFMMVIGVTIKCFMFKIENPEVLIQQLVEISNKARQGGLLSIESEIPNVSDEYLAKSLQMTVDGVKTSDIAQIMQKKMALIKREHKIGVGIYSNLAKYAPAFGMVGTLIGLVQMLASLDDPSTIGPKMAVAMITTFYGAILANLFFTPMSDKLKIRSEQELTNMTLLFEGVISIREGEHPRLMEDKLNVYLAAGKKAGADKKE